MKAILTVAVFAMAMLASRSAVAQRMTQDDLKWINQCIADNRGAASAEVIRKYCQCMNDKMDDNETRSISQWEKANPKARAECDRVSGWK
jgi:hypothetical protein